jgi:hypothetical protein
MKPAQWLSGPLAAVIVIMAVFTISTALPRRHAFAQDGGCTTGTTEQNAVYGSCKIFWENANGNQTCTLYIVPHGKRLVFQHASILCSSRGYPVINAFVGGKLSGTDSLNAHFIPMVSTPTAAGGNGIYQAGGGPMTAYADTGSPVVANGFGYLGASCQATMSGYLAGI